MTNNILLGIKYKKFTLIQILYLIFIELSLLAFDYFTEYWGTSFATGLDGNWLTNPSLANLLRQCNPALIGE